MGARSSNVRDAGQRQARRVQGPVVTMLGLLLRRAFLRSSHASVLRRWEGLLLHAVGRLGVPSLLDGVQRGLLHAGPRHLRDVPEDVLPLHGGAVPTIARHWLRLLWCEMLPGHLRRRSAP